MNVATILEETAQKYPDKIAVIFDETQITYKELNSIVNRLANGLIKLGCKKGEIVSIDLPSIPELAISYFSAMKIGCIANVINVMLKADEVRYILNDAGSVALITDQEHVDMASKIRSGLPKLKHVIIVDGETQRPDIISYKELLEKSSDKLKIADCDKYEMANLLYTSGTTGFPKGVMLSHLNVIDNIVNFAKIHYTKDDILMIGAPMFHCWALINGISSIIHAGGTAIVIKRFQVEKVLEMIEKYQPTIFQGVPTMFNYMLKSPEIEKRDIRSLQFVLSAAASMPEELIKQLKERFNIEYAEAYGLTEVSPVITTAPWQKTRYGSCGYAIVDDKGNELKPGEVGELWARGTAVMLGYLNKPEATKEAITPNGWFKTGDIAKMDENGYVYIVDRKKDMINVAGFKVYPREVEEVLYTHPKIADAAVVGIPDEVKGEVPKVFIVLKPGEAATEKEIIDYVREKIAVYKAPRSVEFVKEIPRSPSGKILRRLLRE